MTEALVFDAFRALKQGVESGSDPGDEVGICSSLKNSVTHVMQMSMTASTLYEAVEPLALWKQLLNAVLSDVCAEDDQVEGIRMVAYIVTTFHSHDEEVEAIHLPVCFAATLETLVVSAESNLLGKVLCSCCTDLYKDEARANIA